MTAPGPSHRWPLACLCSLVLGVFLLAGSAGSVRGADSSLARLPSSPATKVRDLAFVQPRGKSSWLYLIRSDGSNKRRLVSVGSHEPVDAPRWSPNGSQLVFERNKEIFVTTVARPRGHKLAGTRFARGSVDEPAWSPNGSWIAYSDQFGGYADKTAIYLVRPSGKSRRRLTRRLNQQVGGSQWSPDGRRIAFTAKRGIYVMDTRGAHRRRLAPYPGEAAWSPDGKSIALIGYPPGRTPGGIYEVDSDGKHFRVLVRAGSRGVEGSLPPSNLTWSPDGRQLAWMHHTQTATGADSCEIMLVRAGGSAVRQLTPPLPDTCDAYPAWSPDGRQIAFGRTELLRPARPSDGIYLIRTDGSGLQQVPGTHSGDEPGWRPKKP